MKKIHSRRSANSSKTLQKNTLAYHVLEPRQLLATFYVSNSGSDANNGLSLTTPFENIQTAAAAAQPGDTVLIRGGTYRETVSVPRSGTAGTPIRFEAYNNEDVVLSGGDLVTGWVNHAGNLWKAVANWNAKNNRANNTVFVNGDLKIEARQFAENDPLNINDWGQIDRGDLNSSSFQSNQLISGAWAPNQWVGARVRHHVTDWIIADREIAGYNRSTGTLTFSDSQSPSQKQDFGFYIYDTILAADKPGEWFKEENGDLLYYHAEPGQNPNNLEIEFLRRGYGFDVSSRDHIYIDGITFRGVSIKSNAGTDFNRYENNKFYGYGKGDTNNFSRFRISGDNNVFRGNEVWKTYGGVLTLEGTRNELVNNYFHDTGLSGLGGVIVARGSEQLVSYNTVRNFARSFADGYSLRSEFSYNLFEDGGNLSWDTGVFDSDGTNGNTSQSIFHHNVFRGTNARGIFEGFYGGNNNATIHHNIFYDWQSGGTNRSPLTTGGTDFRQVFHNTVIGNAPLGNPDGRTAVQTRYNNNLQISQERQETLGVDTRGNHDYSASDFINFAADDFRLRSTSEAIDRGILLPGINDGFSGSAPDAGALEFGQTMWDVGHDFSSPPISTYAWTVLPGTNIYSNGQFSQGIGDWPIRNGTPNAADRNSWNLKGAIHTLTDNNSLTGSFRTRSVELTPGESIQRTFTGLKPDTTYTVGTNVRVIEAVTTGSQFDASSGSISTGNFRGQSYVTGLTSGEWIRFDGIDFGDENQFDQIEVLYSRGSADNSIAGTRIQIRLDSPTGPLVAEFADPINVANSTWFSNRSFISNISGNHSIYISTSGSNSAQLAVSDIRLMQSSIPDSNKLEIEVTSPNGPTTTARLGAADWRDRTDAFAFTTGATATSATLTYANVGAISAYVDRLYLIEGDVSTDFTNLAKSFGEATQSSTANGALASEAIDGDGSTFSQTSDQNNSWWQVRFSQQFGLGEIELFNLDDNHFGELSNFTVSVWDGVPAEGGTKLWDKSYFESGSVARGGSLKIDGNTISENGITRLASVVGRVVRIQLNGQNNAGNGRLSLANVRVVSGEDAPPTSNAALTGTATQSSDNYQTVRLASDATNGLILAEADFTHTASQAGWWQVQLQNPTDIAQIVLHNSNRFGPMQLSVWQNNPNLGGSALWTKNLGTVGDEEIVTINGNETSNGVRLDSLTTGQFVRIDRLNTGFLALLEVQIWRPANQIVVDLNDDEFRYDFGTSQSPVYGDFKPITPGTTGDVNWSGDPINALDRNTGSGANELSRDIVYSNGTATLSHAIDDGSWLVTLNMGDSFSHDQMRVRAEGILVSEEITFTTTNGTYADAYVNENGANSNMVSFEVTISDGELNLEFSDAGGSDLFWTVNQMLLERVEEEPAPEPFRVFQFDIGPTNNGVHSGVGPAELPAGNNFDIWNGFSVTDGDLTAVVDALGESAPGIVAKIREAADGQTFDFDSPATGLEERDANSAGFYSSDLLSDLAFSRNHDDLGIQVSGLVPGQYEVFLIALEADATARTYSVDIGASSSNAVKLGDLGLGHDTITPTAGAINDWVQNRNYYSEVITVAAGESLYVMIDSTNSQFGLLQGLQIVQLTPPPGAPVVTQAERIGGGFDGTGLVRPDQLGQVSVTFDQHVSVFSNDLFLFNDSAGSVPVSTSGVGFNYDRATYTATWDFSSLVVDLEPAFYTYALVPSIESVAGQQPLDRSDPNGPHTGNIYVALPGDADLDGDVDIISANGGDGFIFVQNLGASSGATWADGDFDGDGDVDIIDTGGGDGFAFVQNLGKNVLPASTASQSLATAMDSQFLPSPFLNTTGKTLAPSITSKPKNDESMNRFDAPQSRVIRTSQPLTLAGAYETTDHVFGTSDW